MLFDNIPEGLYIFLIYTNQLKRAKMITPKTVKIYVCAIKYTTLFLQNHALLIYLRENDKCYFRFIV